MRVTTMQTVRAASIAVAAVTALAVLGIANGDGFGMGLYMLPLLGVGLGLGLAAYFAPTFIAIRRRIPNDTSVAVINLFLGWTLIGWVVALAMAVAGARPSTQHRVSDASGPPAPAKVATNTTKKCPDCAETVLSDAKVCKHCRYRFAPAAQF